MEYYNFPDVELIAPFDNLYRGRHVLVACLDANGNYVLGAKDEYPTGIYRFIGGGIDNLEYPEIAATRELQEEVGREFGINQLLPIAAIRLLAHAPDNVPHQLVTFLYSVYIADSVLHAGDDVSSLVTLTPPKMVQLVQRYREVATSPTPVYHSGKDWRSFAYFYGFVHMLALEKISGVQA